MQSGVSPDVLVCRSQYPINDDIRNKLALFCNVEKRAIIESIDAETIYDVPGLMLKEGLDVVVLEKLHLSHDKAVDIQQWNAFLQRFKNPKNSVTIGLIGKYVELHDAYKSIVESTIHAGAYNEVEVKIKWIHSESLEVENVPEKLKGLDGLLVAPGFGNRGIEGKIKAVQYAREQKVPFLGICLGMQMAVIEFARNVLGYATANSTEMDENTDYPVIDLMENQKEITHKGGTMRLGAWQCELKPDSIVYKAYQTRFISERHRHRYEFNNVYLNEMEAAGMKATGFNPETGLVEIVEVENHPWFVGVQYHPEYKSTVLNPHPLFIDFIKIALKYALA